MYIKSYDIFQNPLLTVVKPNDNFICSEKNYQIQLSLLFKNFPMRDIVNNTEIQTDETDRIYPLRINICKLTFSINGNQKSVNLSNTEQFWDSDYNHLFLKDITKGDIEDLSKWLHNRTAYINFETKGFAKVNNSILEFELGLRHNQVKLGIDEFEFIFLRNTGLQYTYTREFELSSPIIDNLKSKPALYNLYDYVCNLQNNLENALRLLRLSGDPLQALTLIRQPLDSIKVLKKDLTLISDISKALYIDTKILEDLYSQTGSGAQQAAEEIVNQLFNIFDVLFDISSKAFHTKNKTSSYTYKMNPEYNDAEFSLTLALNITNYLLKRIQRSFCI